MPGTCYDPLPPRRGGNAFTVAVVVKYVAIVVVVLIIAYGVLQILNGVQGIL